jgi:hypothetical protein
MGANQNSSAELGLCPTINLKILSSNFGQDRLAIDKLSAFRIELVTEAERRDCASKTTSEIDDKN